MAPLRRCHLFKNIQNQAVMMRDVLLLIGLLLFPPFLFPQQNNPAQQNNSPTPIEKQYESFKNTFDKETTHSPENNPNTNKSRIGFNYQPCALESWVTDFSVPDQEKLLLTLGISDPGLDSANAMKQAVIRAKGLLAMFSETAIQNITDCYTNEYNGSERMEKFTSFSKIESQKNISISGFQIYRQGFTNFGEAIVLAGIPKAQNDAHNPTVFTKAEYFLSEEGENEHLKMTSTYKLFVTDEAGNAVDFTAYKTKKGILVTSILNTDSIEFDYSKFRYFTQNNQDISDDELFDYSYADLTNGLWNAWFLASLRQMEMGQKYTSDLRKMGDIYSSKYQNLTREISENQLGFDLEKIIIKDNTFYLKLRKNKKF